MVSWIVKNEQQLGAPGGGDERCNDAMHIG
jgi:hypothetical protein